jgi:cytoskeletal protein RodZ
MSELGLLLRKARLDSKISLDDLEENTKIRKRYLEAIEEGNYKVLPGSFYVRAFIKSYAEAVGLDPLEVLNMYQSVIPASVPEKASVDNIRKKRTSGRNTDKLSRLASSAMLIGFIVLILGLVYYFAFTSKDTPVQEKPADNQPARITDKTNPNAGTSASGVAAEQEKKPEQQTAPTPAPTLAPTATPSTEVKFSSSERGVDLYSVTGSAKLNIQVSISGADCWIEVDTISADNKKSIQKSKTYKDGETDTFDLDSSAYLNVGAASALQLTVNGTVIHVGDSLNPKRIQLNLQKS